MPPNCPVLQWGHDTRMVGTSLEFRATVAFLLDGVPHHIAGAWKNNKKLAQRDTAERTLGIFVNRWGELAAQEWSPVLGKDLADFGEEEGQGGVSPTEAGASAPSRCQKEPEVLEDYCSKLMPDMTAPPKWTYAREHGLCQAFVEIRIFGVPHTFPGRPAETEGLARADTARRALWYLQCPGYEDLFEPDPEFVRAAAHTIPEAATSWAKDGRPEEGGELSRAERKTAVMRVQNRLQQAYARQLEAGKSVWYWSYDRHPRDKGWPPLFRAMVHVPLAGRSFTGNWARGQREAQIDACAQIAEFLDEQFPNARWA